MERRRNRHTHRPILVPNEFTWGIYVRDDVSLLTNTYIYTHTHNSETKPTHSPPPSPSLVLPGLDIVGFVWLCVSCLVVTTHSVYPYIRVYEHGVCVWNGLFAYIYICTVYNIYAVHVCKVYIRSWIIGVASSVEPKPPTQSCWCCCYYYCRSISAHRPAQHRLPCL